METMPQSTAEQLMDMAYNRLSLEICGFVMQDWSLVAAKNVSDKPHLRFEIDPETQLDLVRTRRNEIIGIYHSHPSGNPRPSKMDLHGWPAVPGWRYWIATGNKVLEWRKKGNEFSESVELVSAAERRMARKVSSPSGEVRRARKRGISLSSRGNPLRDS